jgi:sarcosine oxidase
VLNWYEVDDPSLYTPGRFPVLMWMHGAAEEQCYGFPIPPGFEGLKIASEAYEAPLSSPRDVPREVAPDETRGTYERHVAGRFRNARPHCLRAKTCFYTMAPDSLFTISDHPDSEHITIVSACSGHGFKHSAAIGEAVAEKLLDGGAKVDLTGFALPARNRAGERPGLTI